jgi:formate dehydrogenase subunit gamma
MPPSPDRIRRFSSAERWIHLTLGALMGICILTAAILYWGPLSTLVGRRELVEAVHYTCGLLLPVPLVVGALASRTFRADVRRLNRFLPGDWRWLRSSRRRSGAFPSGKFNAGQKLNSAFVLASVIVLFVTGLMLHYFTLFPDDISTGATFVHDAFAAAVVVVSAGHLWMAWQDPDARRGLRTGFVPRAWAEREHALWAATAPSEPAPGGRDATKGHEPPVPR